MNIHTLAPKRAGLMLFVGNADGMEQHEMDARGVDRLLEKTYGMAETAIAAGAKTIEGIARDARLADRLKQQLIPLFRRESLTRTLNYTQLGLAVCSALAADMEDDAARARLAFYRAGFQELQMRAQNDLVELETARTGEQS